MKAAIVEELLKVTRPTLLKKVEDFNIPVQKTAGGNNVFKWSDVSMLFQKMYFSKPKKMVLSISQNKGGVGKTTTTINLGYLFSSIGRTLLIDMDSQANLTQVFNIYNPELVLKDILDDPKKIKEGILNISENLSIIPNDINFDQWKQDSNSKRNVQYFLQRALKLIRDDYDFILIDCPPSIDLPFEIALNASSHALILMDGHSFSLKGLQNIVSKIDKIIEQDSEMTGLLDLKILGLAFTRYKDTVLVNQVISQAHELNDEIKIHIFNTKIRENISIPESQALEKPVFLHNESCYGSIDYFKLFTEIMEQING